MKTISNISKKNKLANLIHVNYGQISSMLSFPDGEKRIKMMLKKNKAASAENISLMHELIKSCQSFQKGLKK